MFLCGVALFGWGWWWLWNCSGWWPTDRINISLGLPLCGVGACLIVRGLFHALASADRRAEYVRVVPLIVSELKLGNVQRHVFSTDFVEGADYATFEDRPEALNRIGVNCADDVFATMVIDGATRIFLQTVIAAPAICREQANFVGNDFAHEIGCGFSGNAIDNAGDNVALTLNGKLSCLTPYVTRGIIANLKTRAASVRADFYSGDRLSTESPNRCKIVGE